ncbi:hypothetical protein BT69DRAFT_248259 [Atractiella rhizophila]|nr:hypothetical protein BT69DRAFT_248259 [Atractiella rhizophila]
MARSSWRGTQRMECGRIISCGSFGSTYILSNPHNNIINWSPSGKYLVIPNEQILIEEVVVVLWKQKDYSSFARQLNIYGFKRVAPAQQKDIEEPFPTGSKVWQHEFLVRESSCEEVFKVRRHATNKKNPGKVRNSPGGAGTRRLGVKHKKWGRRGLNEINDDLLTGMEGSPLREEEAFEEYDEGQVGGDGAQPGTDIPIADANPEDMAQSLDGSLTDGPQGPQQEGYGPIGNEVTADGA